MTSFTIKFVGLELRWLDATREIRYFMCSTGGVAANRSGLESVRISLATMRLRWLGRWSSPLLISTHRSFIGGFPVSLKHSFLSTLIQTCILRTVAISSARASSTSSFFNALPETSSQYCVQTSGSNSTAMTSTPSPVHFTLIRLSLSTLACRTVPRRIARHKPLGYIAAALARPSTRGTCRCIPGVHFLLRVLHISLEFVRKTVGFLATPSPSASLDVMPNWHMSALALYTHASFARASMHGSFQASDVSGCSCVK